MRIDGEQSAVILTIQTDSCSEPARIGGCRLGVASTCSWGRPQVWTVLTAAGRGGGGGRSAPENWPGRTGCFRLRDSPQREARLAGDPARQPSYRHGRPLPPLVRSHQRPDASRPLWAEVGKAGPRRGCGQAHGQGREGQERLVPRKGVPGSSPRLCPPPGHVSGTREAWASGTRWGHGLCF